MKKVFLLLLLTNFALSIFSQTKQNKLNMDSVYIDSKVEFYVYDGPYGDKENLKEPAVKFILTVKNKGTKPIPDLGVTNRSEYVHLIINDSVQNPVSMYNGAEAQGSHMLKKNATDSYTWWIFEKDAYARVFTVQWQYMDLFSKKIKVNMTKKTAVILPN